MENKKNNTLIGLSILLVFCLFSFFSFFRLNNKKEEIKIKEQYELLLEQQKQLEEQMKKEEIALETPTPTPIDNLISSNNEIDINKISNYPLNELTFNLNGVDCTLPYTVSSMVSYGYLFRDKIVNSEQGNSYTYNQLSEVLQGKKYSSFIDTLSPGQQIVSILIKNPYDNEQPMTNCDVYGISASTCLYGISEQEPIFSFSNGVYLGMSEGELIKIMGSYDKKFYVDETQTIARYQWYQSLDGQNINNIMTCDVLNGTVHMLSIEF